MRPVIGAHTFNNDLKLDEHDWSLLEKRARIERSQFSDFRQFLEPIVTDTDRDIVTDKDLVTEFNHYNDEANRSKTSAQLCGFLAIGLILFTLVLAIFLEPQAEGTAAVTVWVWASAIVLAMVGGWLVADWLVDVAWLVDKRTGWQVIFAISNLMVLVDCLSRYSQCIGTLLQVHGFQVTLQGLGWIGAGVMLLFMGTAVAGAFVILGQGLAALYGRRKDWRHNLPLRLAVLAVVFCAPPALLGLLKDKPQTQLAAFAALCGVMGIVIGLAGALIGRRKRNWLYNRLRTERIRQFHFQTFLYAMWEILEHGDFKVESFKKYREKQFRCLKAHLDAKNDNIRREFRRVTKPLPESDSGTRETTQGTDTKERENVWLLNELVEKETKTATDVRPDETEQPIKDHEKFEYLFQAYRALRVEHQLSFAELKLGLRNEEMMRATNIRPDDTQHPIKSHARFEHMSQAYRRWQSSPAVQAKKLWMYSFRCIIAIFIIHASKIPATLASHLDGWPRASEIVATPQGLAYWRLASEISKVFGHQFKWLQNLALGAGNKLCGLAAWVWSHSEKVVILFALCGLALRAVEQGLQPEREKERYQQYRWAVQDVLTRFDKIRKNVRSGGWKVHQARAALRIMEEMERLSYREMRDFLICNKEAMFVM
jgi:hypothetical protein